MKNKHIILLTIVFSIIFAGCSQTVANSENSKPEIEVEQSEKSNEELFNEIMSEVTNQTTAHLKMFSESEVIFEDSSAIYTAEHEIKYDMREDDNIKYHSISSAKIPMLEGDNLVEVYYLGGYFYTNYGDSKIKTKVEEDTAFPQIDFSSAQFKAEDLIDFSFEEKEEHNVFTYAINEVSLPQYIEEIEQMHGIADGIEFITASGETVISKDGKILESNIRIEVNVDSLAFSATIITNTYTEYYSINEEIEILPPDDLQDYLEL